MTSDVKLSNEQRKVVLHYRLFPTAIPAALGALDHMGKGKGRGEGEGGRGRLNRYSCYYAQRDRDLDRFSSVIMTIHPV